MTEPECSPSEGEATPCLNAFFTAANPSATVSVVVAINGRIDHVDLAPAVSSMTERELGEEISFLAELAVQKSRAAQHEIVVRLMGDLGHDRVETGGTLQYALGLPSPASVQDREAEALAARYGADDD